MNNYIIIGDSLTYGIGDFETGGWAQMFKNYIVNQDDSKVCNNYVHIAAYPGAISTNIIDKLDNIYKAFKRDDIQNVVILSIGVNDTQEFESSVKTSLEDYKKNIQSIIDYVKGQRAELIILGLSRIQSDDKFYWKPSKFYSNETIGIYDHELELLCQENGIRYIPMADVLDKVDYVDGLHPNANGHRKIFGKVR